MRSGVCCATAATSCSHHLWMCDCVCVCENKVVVKYERRKHIIFYLNRIPVPLYPSPSLSLSRAPAAYLHWQKTRNRVSGGKILCKETRYVLTVDWAVRCRETHTHSALSHILLFQKLKSEYIPLWKRDEKVVTQQVEHTNNVSLNIFHRVDVDAVRVSVTHHISLVRVCYGIF